MKERAKQRNKERVARAQKVGKSLCKSYERETNLRNCDFDICEPSGLPRIFSEAKASAKQQIIKTQKQKSRRNSGSSIMDDKYAGAARRGKGVKRQRAQHKRSSSDPSGSKKSTTAAAASAVSGGIRGGRTHSIAQKPSSARSNKASNYKKSRAAKMRTIKGGSSSGRGNYKCKKCGRECSDIDFVGLGTESTTQAFHHLLRFIAEPKRGHVCKFDFWDRPVVAMKTISCQAEMDPEMTVRMYKAQCARYAKEELQKQVEAATAKAAAIRAAAEAATKAAVKVVAAKARALSASSDNKNASLTTPPFPVQRSEFLVPGGADGGIAGLHRERTSMELVREGPEVAL